MHKKCRIYTSRNHVRYIANDTMKKKTTTHELPLGMKIGRPPVEDGQSISSVAHRTLNGLQAPISRFIAIERTQSHYTGGYNRRVSNDPQSWSIAGPHSKRREVSPFITALRYFISLTCSNVGVWLVPNTPRISSRNRCRTWGLSASIAMAKVRVDAVCNARLASVRWPRKRSFLPCPFQQS